MSDIKDFPTVGDVVRFPAQDRGDAVAMVFGDEKTTYREFDQQSNQAGNGLLGFDVPRQGRIAVMAKNSADQFVLIFGAVKAALVMVSVNWRLAGPEVAYIINDSGAEILFVGEEFYGLIGSIRDDLTSVRQIIAMDGGHPEWPAFRDWRDQQDTTDPAIEIVEDDVAIQMYTSGTTGNPKGVQLTHANYRSNFHNGFKDGWRKLEADDVSLMCMPMFHVGGVNWGMTGFAAGCLNIIMKEAGAGDIIRLIEDYKVTRTLFVPAIILMILQHPDAKGADFSSVTSVCYGAAPIPFELLRDATNVFSADFVQLYGMTETTGAFTHLPAEDHDPQGNQRMRSCGKANSGVEVKVVDDDGNPVPQGSVGEIIMRSGGVMKGYWNLPDETAKTIRDGWLYTGDAGFFDEDDYLYIHDRVKDMIVSGGENIYPAEVESALFGHPAISDVAVIGIPDDRWGEGVKAVVYLKEGESVGEEELITYARERIAGYKVPKSVDFYPEPLPRNPSGKLLKRVLRAPYWEGRERSVN